MDFQGESKYTGDLDPEHDNTREFLLMIPGAIIIVLIFGFFIQLLCSRRVLTEDINELAKIEIATKAPTAAAAVRQTKISAATQTVVTISDKPCSSTSALEPQAATSYNFAKN